jgi:hypothetical protein
MYEMQCNTCGGKVLGEVVPVCRLADVSVGTACGRQLLKHLQPLAQVLARQNEPLCRQCLIDSLSSKVRHVIKQKSLIEPGDRVLAAVSGGELMQFKFGLCCAVLLSCITSDHSD